MKKVLLLFFALLSFAPFISAQNGGGDDPIFIVIGGGGSGETIWYNIEAAWLVSIYDFSQFNYIVYSFAVNNT